MGVDIQTYRGRIGCFSRNFGTDVLTFQYIVNFTRGLKTIGAVVFIGILLLLAGIEQNPGPISESTSTRTPANATILKVCGLPKGIGIDSLMNTFEKIRREGGGKVLEVKIYENDSFALVEFEEAEALQLVLRKRTIQIEGKDVSVEIYIDEGSMDENNSSQMDDACDITDLQLGSDFEHLNTSGAVAKKTSAVKHSMGRKIKKRFGRIIKGFKSGKGDKVKSETTPAGRRQRKEYLKESLQTTETKTDTCANTAPTKCDEKEPDFSHGTGDKVKSESTPAGRRQRKKSLQEYLQTTETKTDTRATTAPTKCDKKEPEFLHGSETKTVTLAETAPTACDEREPDLLHGTGTDGSSKEIFWQMLAKLGLTNKYPSTISIRDIVAVDTREWNKIENGTICSTDIPWLVLKRLISSHSESRDISATNEQDLNNGIDLENTLSFLSDKPYDKQDISPLDAFFIIFQCCDPFLKQVVVQKLYICKIAVPFLYKYWESKAKPVSVLSVWPLRSLAIENKETNIENSEVQCKEIDILELQTKMIAFGRLGRPRYSKSKLMNSILSDHGCKTFFNFDCPFGMTERKLINGQVEMFWLPLIGGKKERFQEAMTFLNLRGDIEQHFDAEILTFISTFVDTLTIIVDIETILKRGRNVTDVLVKFSSVILIIANPMQQETIQAAHDFEKNVLKFKPHINLRLLSTHNGIVERNVVEMVTYISVHIAAQLKSNCTKSYHERLHKAKANIRTDEDDKNCQLGREESDRMITQMNDECKSCSWKQTLTPVHSKFSKELGQLIKEREREKGFEGGNVIDARIKTVRENQIMSITKSVELFTDMLRKYETNLHVLKYFLCWLHFHIEREKRQSLPQLMNENRLAWRKLKLLKSREKQVQSDLVNQENTITKLEEQIDEASFSIEHFFREIGHINEAILELELEKDCSTLNLPPLSQMSRIIGRLVADGHQLELIDGESFYMPYRWIKAVFKEVDKYIRADKVLTLSVLGLQSSGKSTFLNTMFGCQFSTRSGRCTRGIHVKLIPVDTTEFEDKTSDYNFILVVDTEGLRSPELNYLRHEHDNELATAITGIGDVTLINIMGENTSEIRDILQVLVHALLRLKMTNKALDLKKSCAFIHQNVTDTAASENLMSGLSKLIQTLDEVTKESAESIYIKNITNFNQVIEFDINSQVWYLKNLWQGNPPMAKVNTAYSETVVDIKSRILNKALTMKDKSYKSLNDITEHAYNIWKGVLNEDFVFSFRNSIEIKAYNAMEYFIQDQLFNLDILIRNEIIHKSRNRFANCDHENNLSREQDSLNLELNELLLAEKAKSEEVVKEFFKKDKYKDIIIQWQKSQALRFEKLSGTLEQAIENQIKKDCQERAVQILTVTCCKEHEEELRKMSMEIAHKNREKILSKDAIDNLFDNIWQSFVNKVHIPSSDVEKNRTKTIDMFYTCLKNTNKSNLLALRNALEKSNRLTPLPNLTTLKGTFSYTGIDDKDISLSAWQKTKDFFSRTNVMKNVETRADEVFEAVDKKIGRICQIEEEITEVTINKFLHEISLSITNMFKGDTDCEFQMPFYEKLLVHVSRHAHVVFEKHNENYFKTYGAAARLNKYKIQQKISFEAHLRGRLLEDVVSKLFVNVIESFADEWTSQTLPNRITDDLYANLPSVKNRAIIEICTDLLEKGDFDNFIRYIRAPKDYASSWITHKANHFLFAPESRLYSKLSSFILQNLFLTVKECVQNVRKKSENQLCISIDDWVKCFQKLMKESGFFIPTDNFSNMKKETETIENLEYLTDEVLKSLVRTEEDLVSRFDKVDCGSVQWANSSPIERLIQKIWGCQEQCPFCGEPCTKNEDHADSDHNCMQHRPLCCIGIRYSDSKIAELASCEFNVKTDITHRCGVFNYKCNNEKREKCGKERHPYKDYKTILSEWYIAPSTNMHDSCRYWMWFVATYKDRLSDYFKYKFEDIPSSWKDITKSSALKSLSETYSA